MPGEWLMGGEVLVAVRMMALGRRLAVHGRKLGQKFLDQEVREIST